MATTESHANRAYLETTNAIIFTDEDMEVEHPDHCKPLYLMATINGVQIRRALVDIRASLNLIALSTLEAVDLASRRILGICAASPKGGPNNSPDQILCDQLRSILPCFVRMPLAP